MAQLFHGSYAYVEDNLRAVFDDEFGEAWVHEWLRWEDGGAFADPGSVLRSKKTTKRADNYRWYFGCEPPEEQCLADGSLPKQPPAANKSISIGASLPEQPPATIK